MQNYKFSSVPSGNAIAAQLLRNFIYICNEHFAQRGNHEIYFAIVWNKIKEALPKK